MAFQWPRRIRGESAEAGVQRVMSVSTTAFAAFAQPLARGALQGGSVWAWVEAASRPRGSRARTSQRCTEDTPSLIESYAAGVFPFFRPQDGRREAPHRRVFQCPAT